MACIENLDETPMIFLYRSLKVLIKLVEKNILMKTTGHEKRRFTVVLACMAGRTKEKSRIMFKRKTMPKEEFPVGVFVQVHPKGWMDG